MNNTKSIDSVDFPSRFWRGFWRLADPKISLASFAGMFLGAAMASESQSLEWGWLAVTVAGIFSVEISKNAFGDVVDYESGADLAVDEENRSPFSGGKRVLVDNLLTRSQTRGIAMVFYVVAIVLGLAIALFRDERVLVPGVIGMAIAWSYHGWPVRLSYRGWGELAVAVCYGPLIVCGTYLVQTGTITAPLVHCSATLGILIAAFLWINEFPDYEADKSCNKHNLVVRMGLDRASLSYIAILGVGYLWLVFTALTCDQAMGLLWGLVGMPAAVFSAWRLLGDRSTRKLIPAQAACLASFVLMALGAGIGY